MSTSRFDNVCNAVPALRSLLPFNIAGKDISIKMYLMNVRSICNKLDLLKLFLDEHRPDILAVTESWGRPALLDSFLTFDDYMLFRRDRCSDRIGGGVFLLVRQSLLPSPFLFPLSERSDSFEDAVWCSYYFL